MVGGVTVVVQNTEQYTYFGERAVQVAQGATLDSGDLAGAVLKRTSPLDVPTIAWRALSSSARIADHRQIHAFSGVRQFTARSRDDRPLPLQVDGDHIGDHETAEFSVVPRGLAVVA